MNFTKLFLLSLVLMLSCISPATAQQNTKTISQDIIMDFGLNFARACDRNEFVLAFAYRACKNAGYKEIYDVKDQVSKISDQKESRELFFKQFYLEYPEDTKMIYAFSMVMKMNVDNSKILAKYIIDKYGAEKKKEQEAIAAKQKIEDEKKEKKEKERLNAIAKIEKDFNECKNEIEKHYSIGVNKIKQGNYESAVQDLQIATNKCNDAYLKTYEGDKPFKKYSTEINNLSNKILSQIMLAETRIEITRWDKLIKENPKNSEMYRHRGNCRLQLLYNLQTDTKSADSLNAINDLNKAIELSPKSDSAYFSRGYLKGLVFLDYKGGIADFNKTIKYNPKYKDAYLYRAGLKGEIGKEKDSNADLKIYNELLKETEEIK